MTEMNQDNMMTDKQRALIISMNKYCREKFNLSYPRTKNEARAYISRNMENYKELHKLKNLSNWALTNGYF